MKHTMNDRMNRPGFLLALLGFAAAGYAQNAPIDPDVLAPQSPQARPAAPAAEAAEPPQRIAHRRAIDILLSAALGEDPYLRANAIEAMQQVPQRALPLAQKGLNDPHPVVRYASTVTAGMLKFDSLKPAIRPLLNDSEPAVRAAAIYSLYALGERIDLTPLATMLTSQDPHLRANVALLLGLLGDKSAIDLLKSAAGEPMPRASAVQAAVTRMQIAEAIARLGDDSVLNVVRAGAYSEFGEVRIVSINAMGVLADRRMEPAIAAIMTNPDMKVAPDQPLDVQEQGRMMETSIQLAAAGALARMGSARGVTIALNASRHTQPVLRSQAAWVLGWLRDDAGQTRLAEMLDDPNVQVRVAAAASIVRRYAATPAATSAVPTP